MNFLITIFALCLFLINPASSEQKIVFVDMDRVISSSNSGVSIFKQLKDINNKNLTFLKKEEKKFKEKETKLIAQKNIISKAEFKTSVDKLKSEIDNYNQNRNKMYENFNKLKVENTNNFLKLINPILTKYSIQNEISIILQKKNLIIGKIELDITDEIIMVIDSEIKEFKIK